MVDVPPRGSATKWSKAVSPSAAWLAGIVVTSVLIRIVLARHVAAPWIFADELIYSELAKSFAGHGTFSIRGVPTHGLGFVYPIVIAPAWRLFASMPHVYVAAKTINAVVMSLTAVPTYFLARHLLPPRSALVAAALTVTVPSMLYTGMLMTENVFYPLFVIFVLALVRMLEEPTPRRQVVVLLAFGLAYLTRAEAIAFVPAMAVAPILLALIEQQRLRQALRQYATLYGVLAGGVAAVFLATAVRNRPVSSLLGGYAAATGPGYSAHDVLRYLLYHAAELDLSFGVVPFAMLLAMWFSPRVPSRPARVFVAASLPVVVFLIVEVSAFASENAFRIEERDLFYLVPLALIALLRVGVDGDAVVGRRPVLAAALVAAGLPFFLPFQRFVTPDAVHDSFALLPWWWLHDRGVAFGSFRWVALGFAAACAALALLPRRYATVVPALVTVYFVGSTVIVESGSHSIRAASRDAREAGIRRADPDWVDRAVTANASVAYVRTGFGSFYTIWENEFFNRSIGSVYNLIGSSVDALPETVVARRADGTLIEDGRIVRAEFVLADESAGVEGKEVARDPAVGAVLYRTEGPIVLLSSVAGLYPNDSPSAPPWSGRTVTYTRLGCSGGTLSVGFASDPGLFQS
ncbi:MAG TPA: glycosyltransferase family 39 protein, partial [Gaiellaceae bacterium]|nr:glycosyltransferase family 39 protein [Gaiellaceae bacterium]